MGFKSCYNKGNSVAIFPLIFLKKFITMYLQLLVSENNFFTMHYVAMEF